MVSEDRLMVLLGLDTSDSDAKLAAAEAEAERVMTKMERIIVFVKTNSQKLLRSMQSVITIFSGVLKSFGLSLGPVGEALLATISVVVASVIQMQSILAAGTGGASLVFGVAMVSASIAISILSVIAVQKGMRDVQSQLAGAQSATLGALSLFRIGF